MVKQAPDLTFALDEPPYRPRGRRFESELELWRATEDIHTVMAATCTLGSGCALACEDTGRQLQRLDSAETP